MIVSEAMRYLGAGKGDAALRAQVDAILQGIDEQPRFVYRVFELTFEEDVPTLGGFSLPGETAKTMLEGCCKAAVLGCTMGVRFDRRLRAMQARSMADAAIMNACGSALVERGCDEAQEELAARFPDLYLTDRFSPGYGDLPLSLQPQLFAAADLTRRLGITLSESMLMNPVKSVTAIIGLADTPRMARIRGCGYCSMKETCALRKGGKYCGL